MPIPHVQRLLCGEPADRVNDREPGAGRALGVLLLNTALPRGSRFAHDLPLEQAGFELAVPP